MSVRQTSLETLWDAVVPTLQDREQRVVTALTRMGGEATSSEIIHFLNHPDPNEVRPRLTGLAERGVITEAGTRFPRVYQKRRRREIVWRVSQVISETQVPTASHNRPENHTSRASQKFAETHAVGASQKYGETQDYRASHSRSETHDFCASQTPDETQCAVASQVKVETQVKDANLFERKNDGTDRNTINEIVRPRTL